MKFRKLLAPEIKHAAAEENGLPQKMRTPELSRILRDYYNAHERMKNAVAQCNTTIGHPEGRRLSLAELEKFFSNDLNRHKHPAACREFAAERRLLFEHAEHSLNAYCMDRDIYLAYVNQYYGTNQLFAFQLQVDQEDETSMVDIAAMMLFAQIFIHSEQNQEVIYRTKRYGDREVHIQYFHRSQHFVRLEKDDGSIQLLPSLPLQSQQRRVSFMLQRKPTFVLQRRASFVPQAFTKESFTTEVAALNHNLRMMF